MGRSYIFLTYPIHIVRINGKLFEKHNREQRICHQLVIFNNISIYILIQQENN